ncbi:hypothetical protein XP420_15745 [Xanthomonas perforans]|nr:hypothetical protein XP420_15745 [Xanthomonas perforans]
MPLTSLTDDTMTDRSSTRNLEPHTFEFSSAFLMHAVYSQSSTLGRSCLACVTNSIDAGASKICINLSSTAMSIADDGHGFRSREEVLECFNVFGFDHTNHVREFGRFGLGRAQLWAWCKSKMYSHNFLFDVDIRQRGFNWYLGTEEPHVHGMRIEATFYKPLTNLEMVEFRSELEKLVRYSEVPVLFNGEQLSRAPSETKWTITTEEAFLRVSDGYSLAIYNQGIFVASLSSSNVGIAGTLVTRRGHNLTLNVSRNEIMRQSCPVWAKLQPKIAELASRTKSKRLNDSDRTYLALQTADPANVDNFDRPIITLSNGKHVTLYDVMKPCYYSGTPITVAEMGNRTAEAMIRDKTAVVLGQVTLERFGVESVAALVQVWRRRLEAAGDRLTWNLPEHLKASEDVIAAWDALQSNRRELTIYENFEDCPGYKQLQSSKIMATELSSKQRLFLRCAEETHNTVLASIRQQTGTITARRELMLGRGEGIDAYTDGQSYVAVVDSVAADMMKQGLPGFMRLAHLLVHEYLHDTEDSGSHAHDLEFMETFHDIVLDQGDALFAAASYGFKLMLKETTKVSRREAKQLDQLASSEQKTRPES